MDIHVIEMLARIARENGLSRLEIDGDGLRVRIERAVSAVPAAVSAPTADSAGTAIPAPAEEAADAGLYVQKSPLVGTLYLAPKPDAEPFVKPGTRVKKGDAICVVEAMKLMSELSAEVSGIVERVCVEDARPVEFGQPIFAIREDKNA
ncbi:MAG: acetyl-CoA carboxylase biotin carboxyl carrier protein [Clostridiaceae bacterium]|nr:acetyl-CoA carboxylase biotin carboxyl carrier protein [Clostridiaceae bacterium]